VKLEDTKIRACRVALGLCLAALVSIGSVALADQELPSYDSDLIQRTDRAFEQVQLMNLYVHGLDIVTGQRVQITGEQWQQYDQIRRENYRTYREQVGHPCASHTSLDSPQCIFAANDVVYPDPQRLTPDEIEFLLSFKAHILGLIEAQNLEIKKRIECLEIDQISVVRDLRSFRQEFADDCEAFRTNEVMDIFRQYKNMKVSLALSQASTRLAPRRIDGQNIQLLEWPGIGRRNNDYAGVFCDVYAYPLGFDGSSFCTERLSVIFDPAPTHEAIRFQFRGLHELMEDWVWFENLPEIVDLEPLTLLEMATASAKYRDAYNIGPRISHQFAHTAHNPTPETDEDRANQENLRNHIRYHSARMLQNDDRHSWLFVEPEQSSAPSQYPTSAYEDYVRILTDYPFMVFMDLPLTPVDVDCAAGLEIPRTITDNGVPRQVTTHVEFEQLCLAWKQELRRRGQTPQEYAVFELDEAGNAINNRPLRRTLAAAYMRTLQTNELLSERMDQEFNSVELINSLVPGAEIGDHGISRWMKLMAFEQELTRFLDLYPEFEGAEERLLSHYRRTEFRRTVFSIAGAVAAGFSCGAVLVLTRIPTPLCLVLTGLGVNTLFYVSAYHHYQDQYINYFASPSRELNLVDLEMVTDADRGMIFEMAFYFVGTGLGEMTRWVNRGLRAKYDHYRDSYQLSQQVQHRILQGQEP